MRNSEVAGALYEIADLLEMEGGDRFRPIAYRRAAREIEALPEAIEEVWSAGGLERLRRIPGVGDAIAGKVDQYLREGRIDALEKLRGEFPPGLVAVMRIPGVGPKTASVLWKKLGITGLDDLRRAAERGQVRRLKGFGEKSEEKIRRGIALVTEGAKRTLLATAWGTAEEVLQYLRDRGPVDRVEAAGSLRRMRETVGDLDILASSRDAAAVARAFVSMPSVAQVVLAGEAKSTVILKSGLQVDLRVFDAASWGAGLQYFTGSKDHNVKLRTLANARGWKLNEYGLFDGDRPVAGETEEGVYAALGLPWIPPELREDQGEIEAAAQGGLPRLVELADVRGDLHVHTDATDGSEPLEAMARAAMERGYAYVGISDHSPSLTVTSGLSPDALRMHRARARALNKEFDGRFTVLVGTECDILEDGSLDYADDVLRELDYAIASVHSKFTLPEKEQTERVVRAIENPWVNVYAHPRAGLIGSREPIAIDLDAVLEAAARTGTAVEVNAYPNRMDLTAAGARLAKEKGCVVAVDTDTHHRSHYEFMRFGVGTARRAWLTPEDVVNCWPVDRVRAFFR